MKELWTATLNQNSPRYGIWHTILGGDDVPLLSPEATEAKLGDEITMVYLLNWPELNEEQSDRLVDFVCEKLQVSNESLIEELDREGRFPIRAEDVVIAFSIKAFI